MTIRPTISGGEARCSGTECPQYGKDPGGWHCVLTGTGQRLPGGAIRLCRPAIDGLSPAAVIARPVVRVVRVDGHEGVPLPRYQTEGAAGFDLRAALTAGGEPLPVDCYGPAPLPLGESGAPYLTTVGGVLTVPPMCRAKVPTGLRIIISPGYEGQIRPRSGAALRRGLTVANAPGTIDADYRGHVYVIVQAGAESVTIRDGERIAQMVIAPVARAELVEDDTVTETGRGAGGFGSTGVS